MKGNSSKTKPRSKQGGFTLVELIVVIAVLAILAGVGAVAYNGYITYAQKGKDRATVGEIIHAIELADYADPTLFGEKGAGVVYLTENGIKAVASGDKLEAGIKDAFGEDLTSCKLNYSGWNGEPPEFAEVFAKLYDGDELTGALKLYQEEIEKNGGSASYASDMGTLWEIVGQMIPLQYGVTGKDDFLQHLVQYCNQEAPTPESTSITDLLVESWTNGTSPSNGDLADRNPDSDYKVGLALGMAQSYAFASYAKNHPSMDAEHLKVLEEYTSFNSNSVPLAATAYYASATGVFPDIMTDGGYWNKIAKDYQNSQAKIDALAFQSLMQAANAAEEGITDSGGVIKDEDYFSAMNQYVDVVGALMVEPELINVYKGLDTTVVGSNYIAVSALKQDGKLRIIVSPDDADPRTDKDSGEEISKAPTTVSTNYTRNFEAGTIDTNAGAGVIALKSTGSLQIDFAQSEMPNSSKVTKVSINGEEYSTFQAVNLENGSIELTFGKRCSLLVKGGSNTNVSENVTITLTCEDSTTYTLKFVLWTIA